MSDEAPNADDELTGPYFDEIRALVNEHRNDLIQRYKERYGVTVPVLTRQQVREAALKSESSTGTDWWLTVALGIVSAFRPDLDPLELRRVFSLVRRGDPTLQLNPQPIEILTAIEALRPPVPRRKSGPPRSGTVDITQVRRALIEWPVAWPPTQPTFANLSLGGLTDRRLRQILRAAETSWEKELREAEQQRGTSA